MKREEHGQYSMAGTTPKQKKRHLSIGQIRMLTRCGEQYRRRYVEGHKVPPGVALLVGRATDDSVSANMNHKIVTGKLLSDEEVSDIARDSIEVCWDDEVMLNEEERKAGLKKTKGASIDKTIRLSRLHHNKLAPGIQPTAVQRWWRLELPGHPRDLLGVIDIQEGSMSVRDTKTTAKSPHANVIETDDQLTAYALAIKILDKEAPGMVALDYLVDTKQPKALTLVSQRTEADFQVFLNRVEVSMDAVERGLFLPADPNSWICSPKFCGFWSTCPYAAKPKTISLSEIKGR